VQQLDGEITDNLNIDITYDLYFAVHGRIHYIIITTRPLDHLTNYYFRHRFPI